MKKLYVIGLVSIMLLTAAGCSNKNSGVQQVPAGQTSTVSSSANTAANKEFTLDELSKYNGQNGSPAYVAVDGVVYDVTHASGWRNGRHNSGITAGRDLSKEILQSPHGKDVLQGLPIVGKLK